MKDADFKDPPPISKRVDHRDFLVCRGNGNPHLVGMGFFPVRDLPGVVFPDTMIALRIDNSRIDHKYLEFVWRSKGVRGQIEAGARTTNGTFKINQGVVEGIQIPVPPIKEQRRIAMTLGQVAELRVKQRHAISLLDDLARSIFLDMFGDPLANPQDWPLRPIAELLRVKPCYGTMIPASKHGGSWLCLRVANIQNWSLNLQDSKFVNLRSADAERHSLTDGDIILARAIATEEHLGKAVVAYPGSENWAFDSHLMRLRFDQLKAIPEFVRETFRTPGGRKLFLSVTRRSAVQYNINTKEISGLSIPVPPMSLQEEYLERLHCLNKLKNAGELSLEGLDELSRSLQDKAFNGEL